MNKNRVPNHDDLITTYKKIYEVNLLNNCTVEEYKIIEEVIKEMELKKINSMNLGTTSLMVFNLINHEAIYLDQDAYKIFQGSSDNKDIKTYFSNFYNDFLEEDKIDYLRLLPTGVNFHKSLAPEEERNYVYTYTFRIRNTKNEIIRYLFQGVVPLLKANVSVGLLTDITHLNFNGKFSLSIIGLNGRPSYFNVPLLPISGFEDINISDRERQIIRLLVDGLSYKEIADQLFISVHTVETHRKNILRKTRSENVRVLIKNAIENNWV